MHKEDRLLIFSWYGYDELSASYDYFGFFFFCLNSFNLSTHITLKETDNNFSSKKIFVSQISL